MNNGMDTLTEILKREGVIDYVLERGQELMSENMRMDDFNLVFSTEFSSGITEEVAEKEQKFVDIKNGKLFGVDIVVSSSIVQPFKIVPKAQKC